MKRNVINFGDARPTSQQPQQPTRYGPIVRSGAELVSAQWCRQADAEALCERLPQDFIDKVRLMSDEQVELLVLLARGVFWTNDDNLGPAFDAGQHIAMRRKK